MTKTVSREKPREEAFVVALIIRSGAIQAERGLLARWCTRAGDVGLSDEDKFPCPRSWTPNGCSNSNNAIGVIWQVSEKIVHWRRQQDDKLIRGVGEILVQEGRLTTLRHYQLLRIWQGASTAVSSSTDVTSS